jgi:type 1 fimbriae regulatory protein FimB/type 1 fimbriae regulatory protein FimE
MSQIDSQSKGQLGLRGNAVLWHVCGYALANRGHDTRALQAHLGHRNIQHTVRYTELCRTASRTSGANEHLASSQRSRHQGRYSHRRTRER